MQSLATISDSLGRALAEICERYTEQELATILDFTAALATLLEAETAGLEATMKHDPRMNTNVDE